MEAETALSVYWQGYERRTRYRVSFPRHGQEIYVFLQES